MAEYRVPILEQFEFQQPVLDKDLSTPPASPAKGDRYIVATGGSGDWDGKDDNIAWYDGAAWQFDAPREGMLVFVDDEKKHYRYRNSAWEDYDAAGTGDMQKSTYDTDDDGIVDKAESVDDGAGNASTAAQVKDAVDKKHTAGSETMSGDVSGTVGSNTVDTVGGKTSTDIADAVDKRHTQNTDQYLDQGGANEITAAQAKEAYTRRAQYDADLGVLKFDIS